MSLFYPAIRDLCIADNISHCDGIHWIVAWNSHDPRSVGHHNVFALSCNPEAMLF